MKKLRGLLTGSALALFLSCHALAADGPLEQETMSHHPDSRLSASAKNTAPKVAYRTAVIEGVEVFYREAGPKDAPAVLLLHGFPTSSHMFRNLIPALADEFHLIAPD